MKKIFLGFFILFDLGLMAGSLYVLFVHLSPQMSLFKGVSRGGASPAAAHAAPMLISTASSPAPGAPAASLPITHNLLFSYRNSHAKRVAIRADFTGWKAEPMQKDAAGVWTYKAVLSPGEYAYCFSVDDKPPLKDPANKRTKMIGRAEVSAVVVEATPSKTPK
jgi:hypothetical protein